MADQIPETVEPIDYQFCVIHPQYLCPCCKNTYSRDHFLRNNGNVCLSCISGVYSDEWILESLGSWERWLKFLSFREKYRKEQILNGSYSFMC